MCALTLHSQAQRDVVLARLARTSGCSCSGGDHRVRFRPPLTVTPAELDAAVDALDRVLTGLER